MLTDGRRTDGRTTDGRTTDAGVTGILIAHLGAFGSGELKIASPLPVGTSQVDHTIPVRAQHADRKDNVRF